MKTEPVASLAERQANIEQVQMRTLLGFNALIALLARKGFITEEELTTSVNAELAMLKTKEDHAPPQSD